MAYAESTLVLAHVYTQQGRYADAEALVRGAYGLAQEVLGPRHRQTALCTRCLADLHLSQGHIFSAAELYEKSLVVQEERLARNHPDIALTLNSLAVARIEMRRFDDASGHLQRAREVCVAAFGQRLRRGR